MRRRNRRRLFRSLLLSIAPRAVRARIRRRPIWTAFCTGEVVRLQEKIAAAESDTLAMRATAAALEAVRPELANVLALCRSVVGLVSEVYSERRGDIEEVRQLLASLDRSAGGNKS